MTRPAAAADKAADKAPPPPVGSVTIGPLCVFVVLYHVKIYVMLQWILRLVS